MDKGRGQLNCWSHASLGHITWLSKIVDLLGMHLNSEHVGNRQNLNSYAEIEERL